MKSTFVSLLSLCAAATTSQAAVLINEVDLANNTVELINTGGAVDMSAWLWCNRVNGSPFYATIASTSTIDGGLSSGGASLANFGAGQTLVLNVSASFLPDTNGELGLYSSASYSSASAQVDYLAWGADGIRDNVDPVWPTGSFIDVGGLGSGDTLQAAPGTEGNGPSEWLIGASTIGAANIPEPASGLLALLGLSFLARRKRG